MKLGVLIPSYQHEKYLAQAIDSVLGQTRAPDRFLVIDDGSSDRCPAIARSYASRGVELVVQENAGAHAALNRGVQLLSQDCEVIAILNSDDLYAAERLEKCLALLEKDEKLAVVCSELALVDSKGEAVASDWPRAKWFKAAWSLGRAEGVDLVSWLAMANFLATTSNIVARSDYLLTNPFQPYRYNHDYYFLGAAALRERLGVVSENLLSYRVHPDNTITTSPASLMEEMVRMQLDLYARMAPELERSEAMRDRFYHWARSSWDNISSFHAGLFQLVLARSLQELAPERRAQLASELGAAGFAELRVFPNRALVSAHRGKVPLSVQSGLAQRHEELQQKSRQAQEDKVALKKMLEVATLLQRSRWVALGRLFGLFKLPASWGGKTPSQKWGVCQDFLRRSRWIAWGGGSAAVRKLHKDFL